MSNQFSRILVCSRTAVGLSAAEMLCERIGAKQNETVIHWLDNFLRHFEEPHHEKTLAHYAADADAVALLRDLIREAVGAGLLTEVNTPGWRSGMFGTPMIFLEQLPKLLPDVVFLGAPYEGGLITRPGTRGGPEYLRRHSRIVYTYQEHNSVPLGATDPRSMTTVVPGVRMADVGDVHFSAPTSAIEMASSLCTAVSTVMACGAIPCVLGGDHSISHAVARAVANRGRPWAYVYLDAHLDCSQAAEERLEESNLHHANHVQHTMRLDGIVATTGLGVRQLQPVGWMPDPGLTVRPLEEGLAVVSKLIPADCDVVLSVDVDVLDPAVMPATGAPLADGESVRDVKNFCRSLANMRNIVAIDIVETSPAAEPIPATVVAELIISILDAVTKRKAADGH